MTILLDVDTRPLHHPYFEANFYHHFSPLYNCLLTPFFLKNVFTSLPRVAATTTSARFHTEGEVYSMLLSLYRSSISKTQFASQPISLIICQIKNHLIQVRRSIISTMLIDLSWICINSPQASKKRPNSIKNIRIQASLRR